MFQQKSCLLLHLYAKYPTAIERVSKKQPPKIKSNFVINPQKSMVWMATDKVIGIYPLQTNFKPRINPSVSPFVLRPKTMKGVVKVIQPSLIGQVFPPPSALSLEKVLIVPLSSQTSIASYRLFSLVWHSEKASRVYSDGSPMTQKNVQVWLVKVVLTTTLSYNRKAF